MEFLEIGEEQKEKWNAFILQNSSESFLQSFEWGEFQKSTGKNVFRYAVSDGEKILGVALIVEHKILFGLKYWYLPRGPIVMRENADVKDGHRDSVLEFFIKALSEKAKKQGAIFLRMDPVERKDGREIFGKFGMRLIAGSVQPKDTLILNLQKSEENILGEMKQKTRYNVRLAEKKGVEVFSEKLSEKNFEDFWKLIEETSKRDGIISHNKNYYYQMLKVLGSGEDGLVARLYFARYQNEIIASNVVFVFGDYAVYLHGASSNSHRNLMAPYLLQWRQIQDAKQAGCRIYDFWGITVANEKPRWAGITRFKKGFGGEEISYVGVYDLPLNRIAYNLYQVLRKKR